MEDNSMSATKNEREHVRQPRDERVLLQVTTSTHGTLPPGTVVRCSTKDISPRGIRIQLDRPLSEGCLLELGVEVLDQPGVVFLAGEVKWCKTIDESKSNLVGVELRERQSDDCKLWRGVLDSWSLFNCDFERV
ncbi:MAG: PilZ domain-containing protein [Lysobacterales bacterium]|nr:MAG: PilZ domain-containing protein [Xanthomonadales bacterium]